MRKTGLSVPASITHHNFEAYKKAGIDCLELSPRGEQYDNLDFSKFRNMSMDYEIPIRSFHLCFFPFQQYDVSSKDAGIRKNTVEFHKRFIHGGSEMGTHIYVIHASGEPIEDDERTDRIQYAKEALYELADYASGYDSIVAVEDLPRTCLGNQSSELLDMISVHKNLKVCFDTNHLRKESIPDFIHQCKENIVTVHFSDYDFVNERHWLPGEGDINWKELMDELDQEKYKGPIVYELSLAANGNATIQRPRDLTPADICQNHMELEGRLTLTTHGTRYPKLGMWGPE